MRFPTIDARDLEGTDRRLPDAFEGRANLVVVAFERWHQELVDTWVAWWEREFADRPDVAVYEVPVLSGRYRLARRFIDGGMAAAIPDPAVRRRTLTAYTDVGRVTRALEISSTATITVLVLDEEGELRWRATGAVDTGSTGSGARAAIDALAPPVSS